MDFLNVNDDCLQLIFGELNLKDQIAVGRAHKRFEKLISSIWGAKYTHLSLSFAETDISDIEYEYFIQNIQNVVKTIRLKFITRNKYEILCKHRFPKVIDFRFQESSPKFFHDEDMRAFVQIFPSIQTFSPQGDFTGKHINHMVTLKHLTLTHCRLLTRNYLAEILKEIPLKSLKLNRFQMESVGIPFELSPNNSSSIEEVTKYVCDGFEVLITEEELNICKTELYSGSINL